MKYMSLKNMSEEEKKARKRKQKNEASKRYYRKNKEYYKNYTREWSKQKQESLYKKIEAYENMRKEVNIFIEKKQKLGALNYVDINELLNILNKVGGNDEQK